MGLDVSLSLLCKQNDLGLRPLTRYQVSQPRLGLPDLDAQCTDYPVVEGTVSSAGFFTNKCEN